MDPTKPAGIRFDQVFLRTAHFSHREDALMLPPATPHPPDQRVNLRVNFYEGVKGPSAGVGLTVSTDPNDTRLLYQFEVEMIALASQEPGQENMPPAEYVQGPALMSLVPFLREAIANLTLRGRFGPIWLSPINIQQFLLEQSAKIADSRSQSADEAAQSNQNSAAVTTKR